MLRNKPVLVRRITTPGTRTHRGLFICRCGSQFEASEPNVAKGHTKSCGCLRSQYRRSPRPQSQKHGHFVGGKPSPTYKSWQAMIARSENKKHPAFAAYGGRGITVCDRWRSNFTAFLEDMGERPNGLTLDRADNNLGYFKENCRWASPRDQIQNRRVAVMVRWWGKDQPLAKLYHSIKPHGISYRKLYRRVSSGLPIEVALVACLLLTVLVPSAYARDVGQYSHTSPELHDWFKGLHNPRGTPCCEDADGYRLDDADWRMEADGTYSVRLKGEWVPVDPDAVVRESNHVGYALVWIFNGRINCFLPGTQT